MIYSKKSLFCPVLRGMEKEEKNTQRSFQHVIQLKLLSQLFVYGGLAPHLAGLKILRRAYDQTTFSGVSLCVCAAFIKAMTLLGPSNFETK